MKKSKIIVPALGILVLSTAAAVTGTVAWFTSSNVLNVSGMHASVDAENGIVIANETNTPWATSASALHTGADVDLTLTSTADLTNWYHANSDDADKYQAATEYKKLSISKPDAGADGTGLGTAKLNDEDANAKNFYLLNRFYIQSASGVALANQDINVKNIVVEAGTGSAELDKAIRVAFKYNTTTFIYGAVTGFTAGYTVNGSTAVTALAPATVSTLADNVTIPAYKEGGDNALEFEVYVYFEGEDAAAKSANITANLDKLAVSFQFENKDNA